MEETKTYPKHARELRLENSSCRAQLSSVDDVERSAKMLGDGFGGQSLRV